MEKKCLKCGQTNKRSSGSASEACPFCGAIYSKVEAHLAQRAGRGAPVGQSAAMPTAAIDTEGSNPVASYRANGGDRGDRAISLGVYADTLRAESLYPTFRQLVNVFYVLGLICAALVVLGGLYSFISIGPRAIPVFLGCLFGALVVVILSKLGKEMWSMLADLSDASVRIAAESARK